MDGDLAWWNGWGDATKKPFFHQFPPNADGYSAGLGLLGTCHGARQFVRDEAISPKRLSAFSLLWKFTGFHGFCSARINKVLMRGTKMEIMCHQSRGDMVALYVLQALRPGGSAGPSDGDLVDEKL